MSFFHLASSAGSAISQSAQQACGSSCGNASLTATFASVSNALIFVIGSVSVIMIIVGGLRFVTSAGDAKQAESARNTILYAVIGVIVAASAFAIVSFVAGKF